MNPFITLGFITVCLPKCRNIYNIDVTTVYLKSIMQ